jgi:hypothetical protein
MRQRGRNSPSLPVRSQYASRGYTHARSGGGARLPESGSAPTRDLPLFRGTSSLNPVAPLTYLNHPAPCQEHGFLQLA